MTRIRKIQIHIAAAFIVICFIGWIVILHVEKSQEEKSRENVFLMQYRVALNDITFHLGQFEEKESFEDQLFCLETIINDLMQIKAYMEMHIELSALTDMTSNVNISGWHEVESAIGFIKNGGIINSHKIESFRADGVISEEEAAVIRLLKEELEKLYSEMAVIDEDGMKYEYLLSSIEVFQRLTEASQNVKVQLIQINQE